MVTVDGINGGECDFFKGPAQTAELIDWTSQMAGFWQSRFDHLEDLLKRMDQ